MDQDNFNNESIEISNIEDPSDSEFLKVEITFFQTPINQDFFLIYIHE